MRSIDPNTVATPSESRAEVLRLTGRNYGVVRHVLQGVTPKGHAAEVLKLVKEL